MKLLLIIIIIILMVQVSLVNKESKKRLSTVNLTYISRLFFYVILFVQTNVLKDDIIKTKCFSNSF